MNFQSAKAVLSYGASVTIDASGMSSEQQRSWRRKAKSRGGTVTLVGSRLGVDNLKIAASHGGIHVHFA